MTESELDMDAPATKRSWKKTVIAMSLGAVFGFFGATLIMKMFDRGVLPDLGASTEVAMLVALVYLLTALSVGVGVISPTVGARFLNVDDAEELEEQRVVLACSAVGMGAAGIALAVVALGGSAGIVSPIAALLIYAALSVLAVWLSLRAWKLQDEFARAMGHETAAMSYYLIVLIGGTWAMLAHLGLVVAPTPLDWLSLFWALLLLSAFIVIGRRGMLKMR